jgi:hypothetical protein
MKRKSAGVMAGLLALATMGVASEISACASSDEPEYDTSFLSVRLWWAPHELSLKRGRDWTFSDGALGAPVWWTRRVPGRFTVVGERLDGASQPLRIKIVDEEEGGKGLIGTVLIFPSPGCWRVTAKLDDQVFSFVVLVEFR